jgi:hypothetical protein
VADRARIARERLPKSPDRSVEGHALRLLDLYVASAQVCRSEGPAAGALGELYRVEESIGLELDELARSLSTYCLRLPTGGAAAPGLPAAVLECAPRDRVASIP